MSESDNADQQAELRDAVRKAMDGETGEVFAERSGVSRDTIYRFLRGETVGGRTLANLDRAVRTVRVGQASGPSLGIGAGRLNPDGSVTLSAQTFGWLIGKLETLAEMTDGGAAHIDAAAKTAHAMGDTLGAIRSTIERAASGVAGLGERIAPPRGVVPLPPPDAPARRHALDGLDAAVRGKQDADAKTPRTSGGAS